MPSTLVNIPDVFSLSTAVTTRDRGTFNRSAMADMESVPSSESRETTYPSRMSLSVSDGTSDRRTVTLAGSISSVNAGPGSPRLLL